MLETEDLPSPWEVDDFPDRDLNMPLDDLLQISEPVSTENDSDFESWGRDAMQARIPVSDRAKLRMLHSWDRIVNTETQESAWLRLQESVDGLGVVISGAIFLPPAPGERLNNRTIRALPLGAIELAVNNRKQLEHSRLRIGFALSGDSWNTLEPAGNPRSVANFYERIAAQFLYLKDNGTERPIHRMAELNNRPLKTVQGWVTEARRRNLLPAASPGLAS